MEVGPLEVVGPPGETPTPAPTAELIPGIINAELNKLFDEPVQIAGVVNARTNIAASGGGQETRALGDADDEDPENPQLDIGDLEGEIDSLKISDEAKALIEPVLLKGEIQAELIKLFPEPVLIDGIINARINYATGAEPPAGGGEGGTGQTAPNIGEFNPKTPGEQSEQGFNLNPDRAAWSRIVTRVGVVEVTRFRSLCRNRPSTPSLKRKHCSNFMPDLDPNSKRQTRIPQILWVD